jgi:uncharacterized Fe-S center protein
LAKTRTKPRRKTSRKPTRAKAADVWFASADVAEYDPEASLPAKFQRMLARLPLKRIASGAIVALKMHVGDKLGYTTIPPLFVRLLVEKIREAGAKRVFVTDGSSTFWGAAARGYTAEAIGAPVFGAAGVADRYFYTHKVRYKTLRAVEVCGNIEDADALVNLSHFKGHGDCGYGGAAKNLAMGCVTNRTRGALHHLEGGLVWDSKRCIACKKCVKACERSAAQWKEGRLEIFWHHCVYCRHCMLVCPTGAIQITGGGFKAFQHGLALAAREVLRTFEPQRVLHINVLTNITLMCDCWGFSMRPLVPDVGIVASTDIVAAEKASLDLVRDGDPLPGSLPKGHTVLALPGRHLFERVHGKDPYGQVERLEAVGLGTANYRLREVR